MAQTPAPHSPSVHPELVAWERTLAELVLEWHLVRPEPPAAFSLADAERQLGQLRREQDGLLEQGRWLRGPRTALQVLGLQHDELTLSRCLAWLLRPEGHHRAGDFVLRRVSSLAGLPADVAISGVFVRLEDRRATMEPEEGDPLTTVADIVVYADTFTLVVESKVFAIEQPRQLDRLRRAWGLDRQPAFLLVTPEGYVQESSGRGGEWHQTTWSQIGGTLRSDLPLDATAEAHAIVNSLLEV
ncbi:MAG: PD-(D/E)XK nuclease family protein [Actinomycetota bacterium]|nr:PD-(D/E)XK nuclease family protein [Actinomycetota bacterium]